MGELNCSQRGSCALLCRLLLCVTLCCCSGWLQKDRLVAELVLCALNDPDKVGVYMKLPCNVTTESRGGR